MMLYVVVVAALWFAAGSLIFLADGLWPWFAGAAGVLGSVALVLLQRRTLGAANQQRKYLAALETANREHADLRQLIAGDDANDDALRQQINNLITRMSDVLSLLLDNNIKIALASAHARRLGEKSQKNAGRQAELSDQIFAASEETSRALTELASRTNGITDANTLNLEVAKQSLVAMGQVMSHIESSASVMGGFGETVERLVRSSENIRNILDTVQGFAAQTNMLALNAAIEAARAGEHGRGFAVVADEVRALAGKVGSAADQISELVEEMGSVVAQTAESTDSAADSTDDAKQAITTTLAEYQQMVAKFEHTHDDLLMVSSTVEELSHSNQEGLERTKEIRALGEEIRQNMQESFTHADVMRDTTNIALQQLARYRLQDGAIEPLVEKLLARRDVVQAKMEQLADEGVDFFDRNYRPLPGSKMDKYEVSWGEPMRRKLQACIDEWHDGAMAQGIIYWLPTDERGYTVMNRSDHSQPETGDPKYDFVHSRYMYFSVDNEVELDNLRQCKDVSMGTFVLPGGQTVITIFAPIVIKGRRWGVFSVGALPRALNL